MIRPLLLALLLSGCFGGGGGGGDVPTAPKPTPPAITVTPGITAEPGSTDREMELLAVTGIRHVRVPAWMDWWGPAQADTLDTFMARARASGFRVMIATAAISNACTWDVDPACTAKVGAWHAELVRRYPDIEGVEAVNEVTAWPPFDRPPAEDYEKGLRISRLLCAVRDSVRAVDPAKRFMPGSGGSASDYLRGLKDGGAFGCMDALVIHGYEPVPPALARIREHTALPVWVTEFGIETKSDAHHLEVWRRGFEQTRGVERLYAFALQGPSGYGVLRADGTTRPSYHWLVRTFGR